MTVERTRRRLKDTRDEPFFWAHVIVTAIIVALLIWFLRHTWSGVWAFWSRDVPALGDRVRRFRHRVAGPRRDAGPPLRAPGLVDHEAFPQEHARDGVAAAIGRGELSAEPPDTRLEEI